MLKRLINLMGQRYGRLSVIGAEKPRHGHGAWLCECDCGNTIVVTTCHLRADHTKSCGCFRKETARNRAKENTVHGMSLLGVYKSWSHMIGRCYHANLKAYPYYGGRGIKVCEFLCATPINLQFLIGCRPAKMSIDRINVNGNYSCGRCAECLSKNWILNVRWATMKEQARNTRANKYVTINGETKCLAEWSELSGIKIHTIRRRIELGWAPEKLIIPVQKLNNN